MKRPSRGHQGEPGPPRGEPSLVAEGGRVLIVDDEFDTIQALKLRLETAGYGTITAADGAEALDLLRETSVDLVVADMMMPNLDGLELTRRVRQDPSGPGAPVLLFSCNDDPIARKLALEFGALDYLSKTLGAREIVSRIQQILADAKPSDRSPAGDPGAYHRAEADLISQLRAMSNNSAAPGEQPESQLGQGWSEESRPLEGGPVEGGSLEGGSLEGGSGEGTESPTARFDRAPWSAGDLPRLAEALDGWTKTQKTPGLNN